MSLSSFDFARHLPSWDWRRAFPAVPGGPFVPGPYLMSMSFSRLLLPFFFISSSALIAHSLSAMVMVFLPPLMVAAISFTAAGVSMVASILLKVAFLR